MINHGKNNLFKYKEIRHYYFFQVLIKNQNHSSIKGTYVILPKTYKISGTTPVCMLHCVNCEL